MQLKEALTTITGHGKESLLISAAKGGNNEVFNTVVNLLDGAVRIPLNRILTMNYSTIPFL